MKTAVDSEETRQLAILGYDERTETWFVRPAPASRLMLTRQSLARLVEMYNGIHQGRQLVLLEQREWKRLEEIRRRQSEAMRELQLGLDRERRRGLRGLWRRFRERLQGRHRPSLR